MTLLLTTNAGFCTQTRTVHDIMIKFVIAMIGTIIASIVIWIGLTIYNRILLNNKSNVSEEILKSPKTIDDAVKFFISKNRLR